MSIYNLPSFERLENIHSQRHKISVGMNTNQFKYCLSIYIEIKNKLYESAVFL